MTVTTMFPSVHAVHTCPRSLFAPEEFLSHEQCAALFDRIVALGTGGGETSIALTSRYSSGATWARNRVHLSQAVGATTIEITRKVGGASAIAWATRTDDDGLREAIRHAELSLQWDVQNPEQIRDEPLNEPTLTPTLWSEPTYALDGAQRGDIAQHMIAASETAGLLAAGELLVSARGYATFNTMGIARYYPVTWVECSMSVRDQKGTASGWAGKTHYDIAKIDAQALAAVAHDKCVRSMNRGAVEPGRYVTILEPQAVADLFAVVMDPMGPTMDRTGAENLIGPFALSLGRSKIGQHVLDRSLTVRSDPMDPDAGFVPFEKYSGDPYQPVSWFADGVLRDLYYHRDYALSRMHKGQSLELQGSYRLSSTLEPVSIDEMIRTTERGILVTRFHNVQMVDNKSVLCTGFTRDGLWLIEHGKISRPIKNFRFTSSPLFAMNALEAVGKPVRVFDHEFARVAPAMKVRDFNFTSLADAV